MCCETYNIRIDTRTHAHTETHKHTNTHTHTHTPTHHTHTHRLTVTDTDTHAHTHTHTHRDSQTQTQTHTHTYTHTHCACLFFHTAKGGSESTSPHASAPWLRHLLRAGEKFGWGVSLSLSLLGLGTCHSPRLNSPPNSLIGPRGVRNEHGTSLS